MTYRVVTLPGDGIGPEIMAPTLQLLNGLGEFEFEERLFGGASIDADGVALTDETLDACKKADAVLLAAVGGPKWDTTDPSAPRPEQGLLGLRKGLGLYANMRPVRPSSALYDASPLRRERIEGTDLLVVRELTGGIYFGEKTRAERSASDLCIYSAEEIERIARVAFGAARAKVSSVDKANVLETSRLWREVVRRVHSQEFPHIALEHVLVDNAAMQLVSSPRHFDVILTENMFGDILSDEAAMITGSIGMLPSASLGGAPKGAGAEAAGGRKSGARESALEGPKGSARESALGAPKRGARESALGAPKRGARESALGGPKPSARESALGGAKRGAKEATAAAAVDGGPGLFEPVHGSAPDIAGKGVANPLAMFLSAALMLRYAFGLANEASAVESAVDGALAAGLRTPDLGGTAGTGEAAEAVIERLR